MRKKINATVFKEFFDSEKNGGIVLILCVVVSLLIANSGYASNFSNLLTQSLGFNIGSTPIVYSVSAWINDGLMAIFFLLVGLEIKRELIEGELSTIKKATLPVFAALGGIIIPATIYFIFNNGQATAKGWGIPMATDIAFALAIVALLGKSIPASLKIFLAALAIVDDLGAISVIAIFYTNEIHWNYLYIAGGIIAILLLLNYFNVKSLWFYLIPGILLWYLVHHSGIHATIAGVILAFTIPTNDTDEESPLEKLEHFLVKPVAFLIMPIFALANTNITFEKEMIMGLISPLGLGIILGLFVGKTIGVSLFSWIAVKTKFAKLPSKADWKHILGIGMLAGIGFTMSIFISLLSFVDPLHIAEAKFAILTASVFSGAVGFFFLKFNASKR
ncbi:Na+/H+ antiporter NhaA [Pedobacter changchengzhani]|uniref:Na(+)/H(+) antiporter NhaA n=1 Tax=Pedobacter changchengzhani TaxID=2529274 RepID=A0A4R5MLZ4_9SPHI|nr:Na+/H+ antiporter NhaA [Pedobacter changchengzhani]TDG36526.1 Na+/H+ antiporter NhaA [Pedobacter changchengzhani]